MATKSPFFVFSLFTLNYVIYIILTVHMIQKNKRYFKKHKKIH